MHGGAKIQRLESMYSETKEISVPKFHALATSTPTSLCSCAMARDAMPVKASETVVSTMMMSIFVRKSVLDSENGVRSAQNMQVSPCFRAGI